eukprot:CAMPEP_0185727386 /NCGR_PEP_ID=MMETSP1171-20130828/3086_1 /TAXON_ID=374046 /ORGANISM="Helicotheca tamensis, Strain CCMP826" /LENGTH=325 /DNA_ID=CAMNT_0028395943 /DNA_START=45 /DNA_END=1022 /DNA_ORIENTATION=+
MANARRKISSTGRGDLETGENPLIAETPTEQPFSSVVKGKNSSIATKAKTMAAATAYRAKGITSELSASNGTNLFGKIVTMAILIVALLDLYWWATPADTRLNHMKSLNDQMSKFAFSVGGKKEELKEEIDDVNEKIDEKKKALADYLPIVSKGHHEGELGSLKDVHKDLIDALKDDHQNQIESLKAEHEKALKSESEKAFADIGSLKDEHQKQIDSLKAEHEKALADIKAEYDKLTKDKQAAVDNLVEAIKNDESQLEDLKEEEAILEDLDTGTYNFCPECDFNHAGLSTSCGKRKNYLVDHYGNAPEDAEKAVITWDSNCKKQ